MTWSIGSAVRAGDVTCVPIVETAVSVKGSHRFLAGHGAKRPTMILVFQGDDVVGLDLTGQAHDAATVGHLYPDAIAKAAAQLGQGGG